MVNRIHHIRAKMAARLIFWLCYILLFNYSISPKRYNYNYSLVGNTIHCNGTDFIRCFHCQPWSFQHIYALNIRIAIKNVKGESSLDIHSPILKTTKHGTVILTLADRSFLIDLTIHMDIEANPGPENYCNETENQPCTDYNSCAIGIKGYSKNVLLSLRHKHSISSDLYLRLKNHGILKSRGVRSGLSVRNKIYKIPVVSHHRTLFRCKNQSSVNLHNLCSLRRLIINKEEGNGLLDLARWHCLKPPKLIVFRQCRDLRSYI